MELIIPTLLKVFNNYISLLLLRMLLVRLFVVIENEDGFSDVSSPSRLNLKRLYSFSQSPQFKEMKYSHHSSIEELVSQQLQRNEMDGINQIRFDHSAPQAVSALEKGLVDFAVITTPVEYKKPLHMTTLYPFKEVLICGRDFNETAQKRQSLHDLLNIPFISLTDGTATHDSHHQYFFDNHLKFTPDIEAATTDQIIPMVKHNLGIGFCPEELARPFIETGDILQIPLIEHEPEREICLIQDMSRGTSIAVSKLINMLVEN